MKKLLLLLWLAPFLLAACGQTPPADPATAYSVTDSQGTVVRLPQRPRRILTTGIGLDGIVLGLVPPSRLVAVSPYATDPASSNLVPLARQIPRKIDRPSAEVIFSLQPDIVFAHTYTGQEVIDALRDLKIPVVVVREPATIAEVRDDVRLIAAALGEPAKGERLVAKMDAVLADAAQKVAAIPPDERRTVLLISLMHSYGGAGCMFDDVCRHAGVVNGSAAAGLKNGQPLTKELIVAIAPDIFLLPSYSDRHGFDSDGFNAKFLDDAALKPLKAIRERRFFYPNEIYVYNSSQDVVFCVNEIAHAAYGAPFVRPTTEHLSVAE